jgi:Flp pilus assembly protein TadG
MRPLVIPRAGQGMVEFALIAILMLMLTVGLVDLAMGVWEYNTVSHLAREGARYGIIPSRSISQIQAYVPTRAAPGLGMTVTVPQRGICGDVNNPVIVNVSYQYQPASGLVAALTGPSITLQAQASMYVEQGVPGVDCACGGTCP